MASHERSVSAEVSLAAIALLLGLAASAWVFAQVAAVRGPLEWDEGGYVWKAHLAAASLSQGDLVAAGRAASLDPLYPPLHALLLAVPFLAFGEAEAIAYGLSAFAFAFAALLLWLAAREVGGRLAAGIALAFLLGSRLHLEYSATALLELPGVALTLLALFTYLRHLRVHGAVSGWIAGASLAAVFFYKYNFGLYVAVAVLGSEALRRPWQPLAATRRGLWIPLVAAATLWFLSADARSGFLAFAGNRSSGLDAMDAAIFYPRALLASYAAWWPAGLLALAGAAASLAGWKREPIRFLALFAGVGLVAMMLHPYKLERSIATVVPALWILSGVFCADFVTRAPAPRRTAVLVVALVIALLAPLVPLYARDLPALGRGAAAGAPPAWSRFAWPSRDLSSAARFILDTIDPARPVYLAGEFDALPPTTLRWKLALRHPRTPVHERGFMGGAPWTFPLNLVTIEVLPESRHFDDDYRTHNAWALEPIRAIERSAARPFAETTLRTARVRLRTYRLATPPPRPAGG